MDEKVKQRESRGEIPRWSLSNWATFLKERAPPVVFLLLAIGPCLSGLYATEDHIDLEKFSWALVGELVLLLLIRVMDDVKDYEKDKIVHPERPLPRGLIRFDEVVQAIRLTLVFMVMFAVLLGLRFSWTVAGLLGLQIGYTCLMYVEFGCGELLDKTPFFNGLIHQLSIYFGAYFICGLGGEGWTSVISPLLGTVAFSGFFTYEICRKLDPTLPRVKGTYLVVYGKWPTFCFTLFTVLAGVVSSYQLGLNLLLWPMEALLLVSQFVLLVVSREPGPLRENEQKPKMHKLVEALSVVYLLLHMWSGYLKRYF